jgi:hypothetical protein
LGAFVVQLLVEGVSGAVDAEAALMTCSLASPVSRPTGGGGSTDLVVEDFALI